MQLIFTEIWGGLMEGKTLKMYLIVIFKLFKHKKWIPYHFEGPPDQENTYYLATIPLSIKRVSLGRPRV